ncbi:MAG: CMD domain protein [Bifidobacteriaceae bacterium]|jgi:alkylhydroperoxidase domain protein/CMD domain protein|nr:CMD domain protein [Bifidobacteriaceae bacterium]
MPNATLAATPDLVAAWAGITPAVAAERRPVTREQTQASHSALFEPFDDSSFSVRERWLVAAFATALTALDATQRYYAAAAASLDPAAAVVIGAEARANTARGPYGAYAEAGLRGFDEAGPRYHPDQAVRAAVGERLAAALEYAHLLVLRPREADGHAVRRLAQAGWSVDGIVTLAQLVAFLAYQQRVAHGLRLISERRGGDPARPSSGLPIPDAAGGPGADAPPAATGEVLAPCAPRPHGFTREPLEWLPWLKPLAKEELTERHRQGLVDAARANSGYFRLLARDPEILRARTLVDKDIFAASATGLPLAERELAAVAVSRTNGCVFCASVHGRLAARYSGEEGVVDRLLELGVQAAGLPERWDLIARAAAALTLTPIGLTARDVERLAAAGLSDLELADLVHAAAFFNWANRLTLGLGRPAVAGEAAAPKAYAEWRSRRQDYWGDRLGPAALSGTWWLDALPRSIPDVPGRWWTDGIQVFGTDVEGGEAANVDGGAELLAGPQGHEVVLPVGTSFELDGRRFQPHARAGLLALRVFDPKGDQARSFSGVDVAAWDPDWVVPARFTPAPRGERVDQGHVDGFLESVELGGSFAFEMADRTYRLAARGGRGRYHIVFGDQSNSPDSPPFRFLRAEAPETGGATVLDFNLAELPPCAFSPHFLCPVPLPGNELDLFVDAGELRPRWAK